MGTSSTPYSTYKLLLHALCTRHCAVAASCHSRGPPPARRYPSTPSTPSLPLRRKTSNLEPRSSRQPPLSPPPRRPPSYFLPPRIPRLLHHTNPIPIRSPVAGVCTPPCTTGHWEKQIRFTPILRHDSRASHVRNLAPSLPPPVRRTQYAVRSTQHAARRTEGRAQSTEDRVRSTEGNNCPVLLHPSSPQHPGSPHTTPPASLPTKSRHCRPTGHEEQQKQSLPCSSLALRGNLNHLILRTRTCIKP